MGLTKIVGLNVVRNLSRFSNSSTAFGFRNGFSQIGRLFNNSNKLFAPAINNFLVIKRNGANANSTDVSRFNSMSERLFFEIEGKLSDLLDNGLLFDVDLHDEFMNISFYYSRELNTIVISKQPATRQIWYSSPLRKPDYFDFSSGWRSSRTDKTLLEVLHDDLLIATGIHVNF